MGAIPSGAAAHTAIYIAAKLKNVIDNTLNAVGLHPIITTDCANMCSKGVSDAGYYWIKCALYCLHNSVNAGLKGVEKKSVLAGKV